MTSPTQKGEREEALERAARFLEQIASPSDDSREIAAQCRSALLSSSKAEGEMREALKRIAAVRHTLPACDDTEILEVIAEIASTALKEPK